ncbi:MAG: HAMP domain-containing protein [Desulfobacteraceae bacterium]|nr:MAG: HAMP domain-containing protein [Desulfobacteraceae bacterium]
MRFLIFLDSISTATKAMRNSSLAARLIFFILTGTAMIFVGVLSYNYYSSKAAIMGEAKEDAKNLALATGNKMEAILQGVERIPGTLALVLEGYQHRRDELVNLIKKTVRKNPEIYGIAVAFEPFAIESSSYYFAPYAYRDQEQIKSIFLGSDSYRYYLMDWYQIPREINRPVWSEPYYDEGGGDTIMVTYSIPFYWDREGNKAFRGIVTADICLMELKTLVASVKIFQTGYAFLVSHNGVFVTHPEQNLIMRESIFSLAEANNDYQLRQLGREMIHGGQGFVPVSDFTTGKKSWMYYTPLGTTSWSLGVIFPEEELFANARQLSRKLIALGIAGLAFLAVLIIGIAHTVTKPLGVLAETSSALGRGDFSVKVQETGPREIKQLARSFNQLGKQLTEYIANRDFIRDTFGRYVTQEVVKRLLESKEGLKLGGETREVSILMSDLRGFTALTADMKPEEVVTFLNRYLGKMIEVLTDHHAIIDEIIGDGILAFFGAPEPMEDHPVHAVACALAMQAAMEDINALNAEDSLPHLEMGIAVNTGSVVVGNIGSEQRTKYSLVGAQVNFTGRMESFTVGGQVLISSSSYSRVKDLVEVHKSLEVKMKGIPGISTLYEVRGIRGEYDIHLKERLENLSPVKEKINVHLHRIKEKILFGKIETAFITHLSETTARVMFEGELGEWEDVHMKLFEGNGQEIAGKIYGKVTSIKPASDNLREAQIRFTSVSPEIYRMIREVVAMV